MAARPTGGCTNARDGSPHGIHRCRPTEHLGVSGLVAAVTAGLITGQGAAQERRALTLALIGAQREAVLHARDEGSYSPATLTAALKALDANSDQHQAQRPRAQ